MEYCFHSLVSSFTVVTLIICITTTPLPLVVGTHLDIKPSWQRTQNFPFVPSVLSPSLALAGVEQRLIRGNIAPKRSSRARLTNVIRLKFQMLTTTRANHACVAELDIW